MLAGDGAQWLFAEILGQVDEAQLLSTHQFEVDGTLPEAAAGLKTFRKKGAKVVAPDDPGNPRVHFLGKNDSNATNQARTRPDIRSMRKSPAHDRKLHHVRVSLFKIRHGLVVNAATVVGDRGAERDAAIACVATLSTSRNTVGGDIGFDQRTVVNAVRAPSATPNVATKKARNTIVARATHRRGYAVGQRIRRRFEEDFGWVKSVGRLRKLRHRERERVNGTLIFSAVVYNLVRMRTLATQRG